MAGEAALVGLATKRRELVVVPDTATALQVVKYMAANDITQFNGAIGQPGAEHDTHHVYTEGIEVTMNQIFQKLSSQCDPAVATLADTYPDFAAQWLLSREIGQSPARRTRALEVHVDDSVSKAPLPDAYATFSNGPEGIEDKRTADGGSFYVQNMEPGEYTMQVSRPGYVNVITPVVIVAGQKTVLTVLLTKEF